MIPFDLPFDFLHKILKKQPAPIEIETTSGIAFAKPEKYGS